MKLTSVLAILGLITSAVSFRAHAEYSHPAARSHVSYTVVIEFRGLVDFVSDGTSMPGEAWVLMADASDVESLPLPRQFKVATHEARLLTDGLQPGSTAKLCGGTEELTTLPITGYQVSVEGDILDVNLSVDRVRRPGPKPCDPSDQNCKDRRPMSAQERSASWLPKIDDLLPSHHTFRPGTFSGSPSNHLTSRFHLDKGTVFSGGLWRDSDYNEVVFNGLNDWSQRAISHGIVAVLNIGPGGAEIVREPLGGGTALRSGLMTPVDGATVRLFVENQPKGSMANGMYECYGKEEDFVLHYILREGSESLTLVPTLEVVVSDGPSSDPQCSPSDNNGP